MLRFYFTVAFGSNATVTSRYGVTSLCYGATANASKSIFLNMYLARRLAMQ